MNRYSIFRNTFKQGVRDSFEIMMGHQGYLELTEGLKVETHYGIKDGLLFPLLSKQMIDFGFPIKLSSSGKWIRDTDKKNGFRKAIGALGLLLQIPRLFIASLLSLIVIPFVMLVHVIKYPFVKHLEQSFFQLKGQMHNSYTSIECTLEEYMEKTKGSLNELEVTLEKQSKVSTLTSHSKPNSEHTPYGTTTSYFFRVSALDDPDQHAALEAGHQLGMY